MVTRYSGTLKLIGLLKKHALIVQKDIINNSTDATASYSKVVYVAGDFTGKSRGDAIKYPYSTTKSKTIVIE